MRTSTFSALPSPIRASRTTMDRAVWRRAARCTQHADGQDHAATVTSDRTWPSTNSSMDMTHDV